MTKSKNNKNKKVRKVPRILEDASYTPVTLPFAMGVDVSSKASVPVVVSGKTSLNSMITAAAPGNSRVFIYPLSTFMAGTNSWLFALSQNYSKFKFRKFVVHYTPSCPTAADGTITIGCGYDMADFFSQNVGGIDVVGQNSLVDYTGSAVSLYPAHSGPLWRESAFSIPKSNFAVNKVTSAADWDVATVTLPAALQRNWFSDGYIMAVTTYSGVASTAGRIIIEYEIELIDPIPSTFNA